MGPLLPKLRGQFAEFLRESSLARLSALTLAHLCRLSVRAPTHQRLEDFLGTMESATYHPYGLPDKRHPKPGAFNNPDRHSLATGHSHSSGQPILMRHPITPRGWDGNINLLSIDYALQPHLRTRLTLRGRP